MLHGLRGRTLCAPVTVFFSQLVPREAGECPLASPVFFVLSPGPNAPGPPELTRR